MDTCADLSIQVRGADISPELKQDIVSLFYQIDTDATGTTYRVSSAEMSRKILDLEESVPDRDALGAFVDHYTSTYVLGFVESTLVGIVLINENDSDFKSYFNKSYHPLVAVHFIGVHPEYQQQGLAKKLLLYVRRLYTNTLQFSYLVAGTAIENSASQNLLESIGMHKHKTSSSVEGDDETIIYRYPLRK